MSKLATKVSVYQEGKPRIRSSGPRGLEPRAQAEPASQAFTGGSTSVNTSRLIPRNRIGTAHLQLLRRQKRSRESNDISNTDSIKTANNASAATSQSERPRKRVRRSKTLRVRFDDESRIVEKVPSKSPVNTSEVSVNATSTPRKTTKTPLRYPPTNDVEHYPTPPLNISTTSISRPPTQAAREDVMTRQLPRPTPVLSDAPTSETSNLNCARCASLEKKIQEQEKLLQELRSQQTKSREIVEKQNEEREKTLRSVVKGLERIGDVVGDLKKEYMHDTI